MCEFLPGTPELLPSFHARLTDAPGRLAATLQALVDAGTEQPPSLAFSVVAQLAALENDVCAVAAAAIPGDRFRAEDDAGLGDVIKGTMRGIRVRLWSLISHLVEIREWSLSSQLSADVADLARASILVTFG